MKMDSYLKHLRWVYADPTAYIFFPFDTSCSSLNRVLCKFEFDCMSLSIQSAISHVNQCGRLKLCSSGCSAVEGRVRVAGKDRDTWGVTGHHWGRRELRVGEGVSSFCRCHTLKSFLHSHHVSTQLLWPGVVRKTDGSAVVRISSAVDDQWRKLWDKSMAGQVEWRLIFQHALITLLTVGSF